MINPFVHIQNILNLSGEEAKRTAGSSVSVEHLMLGMLKDDSCEVAQILEQFSVDLNEFKKHLISLLP